MTILENNAGAPCAAALDDSPTTRTRAASRRPVRDIVRWAPLMLATVALVVMAGQLRWSLAVSLPWQCDEIPLLVRFTGLCGRATNEFEAHAFEPSLYSFRTGAIRSVHVPSYNTAFHTTTGFWANLGLHLFGYGTASGRAGSLFWSFVAIVAAAWATWLITHHVAGACLASLMVALSPMATAYGAQARGYAEAMAGALLLLIALEYVRRRPDAWIRAVLLFLIALDLSLTVYTMWVYFVLPTLLCAVVILPRQWEPGPPRRRLRSLLSVVVTAMIVVMALYTAERWKQLSSVSGRFGIVIHDAADAVAFIESLLRQASCAGVLIAPFAVGGLVLLGRTSMRWWLWPWGLSVVVPILFALVSGSPGYVRNFSYLVGPIAIGSAIGVTALARRLSSRVPDRTGVFVGTAAVALLGGLAYGKLETQARTILLPDWGALVRQLSEPSDAQTLRYLCPDLANHWQIAWYAPHQAERLIGLTPTDRLEIIFGVQRNEQGDRVVFRRDPVRGGIREFPVPDFLASIDPHEERFGIEVRRFLMTPVRDLSRLDPDAPVFVVVQLDEKPSADQWDRLLRTPGLQEAGLIEFAAQPTSRGLVQTMIAPVSAVTGLDQAMIDAFRIDRTRIRHYVRERVD